MSRHDAELGRLIDAHRPAAPWIGWAVCLGFALPWGLVVALTAPGPVVGLAIFVAIAVCMFYGLAEWFFLEHCLYEHGFVTRSVPGLRTYVIPHYLIDPNSFDVGDNRVHEGGMRRAVSAGYERRYRVTPFAKATVRFVGLHPKRAYALKRGRLDWASADADVRPNGNPETSPAMNWWWLSYREPERQMQLIQQTVRQSQQARPPTG